MIEHSSFQKLVGATVGNYRLEQLVERGKMGAIFVASTPSQAPNTPLVPTGNDSPNLASLSRSEQKPLVPTGNDSPNLASLSRSEQKPQSKQGYLIRILDISADLTPEARLVYLGRFQQEANQVAALQHPSILPLVDYGNYQKMPYLVYPYSPTMRPLHDLISQQGPVELIMASRYLDQIAAALEYAHLRAILHRNLTTNSILIETASHAPKLCVSDFGVIHMLEIAAEQNQDQNKSTGFLAFGSSEASAPEQLLGRPVDTHTDIYALGAVLYRLLTGHRVYSGNSQDDIVQQHLHAPIPSVSTRRGGIPASVLSGVDRVIATAMAKEPLQRFHQATMLANAYHEIVAPQDTARPPLVVASAVPTPQGAINRPLRRGDNPIVGADLSRPAAGGGMIRKANRTQSVSRRRVLFYIVAGGAAVAAVTTVAIVGTHLLGSSPASGTTPGSTSAPGSGNTSTVLAKTTDVPINGAKTFSIANQSNPGIIVHLTNGNFVAFDSTCTHAGCVVSYNSQDHLLECPCHGAAFDPAKNAAVVQGPAQTPLASISITVNADDTITRNS
jgi:eukaryotic-like serine/threonine-protein kinase